MAGFGGLDVAHVDPRLSRGRHRRLLPARPPRRSCRCVCGQPAHGLCNARLCGPARDHARHEHSHPCARGGLCRGGRARLAGSGDVHPGARRGGFQHSRSRCTKARAAEFADLMNARCSIDGETVMEVILLERVAKLGQMGDVVRVKDGFARNYLLPQGKALRATKDNRTRFEKMKVELEARNLEQKGEAEKIAQKLDGQSFTVLRQAAEGGQLYGSVSPRDLALLVTEQGFAVSRAQVALNAPIKTIGLHKVPVSLHPEVEVTINVTVARNTDEAQRLARGEDIIVAREEGEEAAVAAAAAAEAFFEPEVIAARRTPEAADETSPADPEAEKK